MCLYMLLGILKVHVRRDVAPAHDVKRSCAHGCARMQDVCAQEPLIQLTSWPAFSCMDVRVTCVCLSDLCSARYIYASALAGPLALAGRIYSWQSLLAPLWTS